MPFIQNYPPETYDFHPQNWAIAQNEKGIIYIANTLGLLEFDGVTWRKHKPLEGFTITALDIDSSGTLYLGGRSDFGVLQPDSSGAFRFTSLVDQVADSLRNFRIIWEIAAVSHGVYFKSSTCIFRWHDQNLTAYPGQYDFLTAIGDSVFVAHAEAGLQQFKNGKLSPLPEGKHVAGKRIHTILEFENNALLLGSRTDGLFLFDGHSITPFATQANDFLKQFRLYHGAKLSGAEPLWAFATSEAGVVVIDRAGRIRQVMNKATGLLDDKTHFLFRDQQNGLWISQNNGISRVEYPSPFSIFDARLGLDGTPHAIERHAGRIYVATNRGLMQLTTGIATHSEFGLMPSTFAPISAISSDQISGISAQIWDVLSLDETLLVGAAERIYSVQKNRVTEVAAPEMPTYKLHPLLGHENTVLAGFRRGLGVLRRVAADWQFAGRVDGIEEEIRTMAQEKTGEIWLGTVSQGVLRVQFTDDPIEANITRFNENQGLPAGWAEVGLLNNRVVVMSHAGLFSFDTQENRFSPQFLPGDFSFDRDSEINKIEQTASGNIWLMAGADKGQVFVSSQNADGKSSWQATPFQRMVGMNSLMDLMPEANGITWFVGRNQKIYRYDDAKQIVAPQPIHTSIRAVISLDSDSAIWAGALPSGLKNPALFTDLPFDQNSLRFQYAAASYTQPDHNQYQIKLEGFDDTWSRWTGETRKDYTELPAGKYTFHARAKNIYHQSSTEANFSFSILPPWYQKWWAYLIYFITAAGAIGLVVKIRVRHLERKTRELEQIINERTTEIARQADELKELDRIKSRFFANISHEFRTPLTLILGPIESAIEKLNDRGVKDDLQTVQRNANRLQRLIEQLLDLSQLEAGRLSLKIQPGNLAEFLKQAVMLFASAVEKRSISLTFSAQSELENNMVYFDRDVVEKAIYNVLSNAIKYTPENGAISVTLSGNETATINVKDSGKGIAPDHLPHVFDRFFQNDQSENDFQQGTGIGLALTRELVELHQGRISVASEPGKGTEFTIVLPVAKSAFHLNEIVENAADSAISEMNPVPEEMHVEAAPRAEIPEDASIILLVDDHAEVRKFIRDHIVGEYNIVEANNGEKGLERALELVPDLIISDVMMPKMDGTEFCNQLKTNVKTSHIPVIMLTARAGDEDKLHGLETGADDYLVKPFNAKELNVRIRNLIEQRRKLREKFHREGILTPRERKLPSVEEVFLKRLMAVVEAHIGDEEFGVEELSKALFLSRRQLLRKLQAIVGQTPTDFIRTVRLRRAKQLLEQKAGTVTEIAFQTGFSSLPYFSQAFKEAFGILPSKV